MPHVKTMRLARSIFQPNHRGYAPKQITCNISASKVSARFNDCPFPKEGGGSNIMSPTAPLINPCAPRKRSRFPPLVVTSCPFFTTLPRQWSQPAPFLDPVPLSVVTICPLPYPAPRWWSQAAPPNMQFGLENTHFRPSPHFCLANTHR